MKFKIDILFGNTLLFYLKWIFIYCLIGLLVGSFSAFFLYSLDWVTNFRETHLWIIALLPFGGFLIGLLYYYFGKEVESGTTLIIKNIQEPTTILSWKMAPFIYLGTMVTHLFGGSAGREGTALQMASSIADQLSNPFKLTPNERKILLITSVAAGFGAVFGTPFAGAIFGLEFCRSKKTPFIAIFPAFFASIIADFTTKSWQISHTHYIIGNIPNLTPLRFIYICIAGILFGGCAYIYTTLSHWVTHFFKTTITFPPLRPLVGGLIIIIAIWFVGSTKYIGLGIPIISNSFLQQSSFYDFILKIAFTILTLSTAFKGGEVTPLFFIGATLGSALSCFIPIPTGLLAGMGFVAVFSGATKTPIACSIMAIELFGIECAIFVFIACGISYFFSGKNGIYTQQIY